MSQKSSPLIAVKNFKKSFGSKIVHNGLNFDLYEKEVVSLIGGSGSGKSVFLKALIGLEKADSGSIFYRGRDVTRLREREWYELRKKVAYAFQGGALFDSFTVEENLMYPLDAHTQLSRKEKKKKITETLELLGLEGTHNALPADLSGGMKKRAGLGRSLILEPEVILYDEPTAGLDPFNTKNIQDIIVNLRERGTGGVLVTHDMPTAYATCERLFLLVDGKISVSGKVNELKDSNEMVKSFIKGEVFHGTT